MCAHLHVILPNFGDYFPAGEWRKLLDLAVAVEQAGADGLSVVDHVVLGENLSDYPYGEFPCGPASAWLEPLTTLSAIAGRTSAIRLSTSVLIAPLRPAALLAKTVATLDELSGGRLDLGVGMGWLAKEYEATGLDYAERGRLLDFTLAACVALWQGGPTTFSSPGLSFSDVYCYPMPVQLGGVPLWIGGGLSPHNLARIVEYGSGWSSPPGMSREEIGAAVRTLHAALVKAGREPSSVRVRALLTPERGHAGTIDLPRSVAVVPDLMRHGVTDVSVFLSAFLPEPTGAVAVLSRLVAAFRSIC